MTHDWQKASAADLGRGIGDELIDPVELTDSFLDAIGSNKLGDKIYARTTPDRARAEAKAARDRARTGQRLSPLDGVPISWKDLFDTQGTATEAGTALLKGRVPTKDARVLANATRAGLVCLGKTHMSELAFSGLGLNPITQTPPCINYPDAVPGGSSSGAGTSVAFGLAAVGIGSDTGGSVRIPSAWNDLVGLKTTHGALSLEGVVPLCQRFDTVGPLTKTVEDAGLLWDAMGGGAAPDICDASLSGRSFLVLETAALDDVREAPMHGFEIAVKKLEKAGVNIVRGKVPVVADAMPLAATIFAPEAYGQWQQEIEAHPEKMFFEILERFRAGAGVSGPEFSRAWNDLTQMRLKYLEATAGYDAVLVPTSPILPPNVDKLLNNHDYFVSENLLALRNTRIGNMFGLAVLTLPTGVPSCGISLMGSPGSESRLLQMGAAAEQALT